MSMLCEEEKDTFCKSHFDVYNMDEIGGDA